MVNLFVMVCNRARKTILPLSQTTAHCPAAFELFVILLCALAGRNCSLGKTNCLTRLSCWADFDDLPGPGRVCPFLPALDRRVESRTDGTIRNRDGNYESTFLTTSHESKGTYELIQVEIEPKEGNGWHYHKTFEEQFTVLTGQLTVGLDGKNITLSEGQTATVLPDKLHFFPQ